MTPELRAIRKATVVLIVVVQNRQIGITLTLTWTSAVIATQQEDTDGPFTAEQAAIGLVSYRRSCA